MFSSKVKVFITTALLLTLFIGCKLNEEQVNEIMECWNATNEVLEKDLFPQIKTETNEFPSTQGIISASLAMNDFMICVKQHITLQKASNVKALVENIDRLESVAKLAEKTCSALDTLAIPEDSCSFQKKTELYKRIHRYVYTIQNELINIEYNNSEAFHQDVYDKSQLVLLLAVIIILLSIVTIFSLAKDSRITGLDLKASKNYLEHVLSAQETERNRISRELHDTVAQDMRYVINLLSKLPDSESKKEIQNNLKQCIGLIRTICYKLTPPDLEDGNLATSLSDMCQKFMSVSKIETRLTITEDVDFSSFHTANLLNIYRIVQEALSNIGRHSQATEATILFRTSFNQEMEKYLIIIISDDGKGISKSLLTKINGKRAAQSIRDHFGVHNIKERVTMLDGTIKYKSFPDCGTEIKIEIPVK